MRRVLGICVLAVLSLRAASVQTYDTSAWDCELLKANPLNLTMEDAIRRATRKVMPEIPGDLKIKDLRVTVVVVVNKDGSVECVHAKEGHPLLISQCIEAAKYWKFKPYVAKDHPIPFITNLTFHFTNHSVRVDRG